MNDKLKLGLKITGAVVGLGILYKIFSKKKLPAVAVKEAITKPFETIKEGVQVPAVAVKKVAKTILPHRVKGSPEAKEFMKSLRSKVKKKDSKKEAGKKGGEETAKLGKHKGHKTKKGLAQDQEKVSKEKHEKHYQKSKK